MHHYFCFRMLSTVTPIYGCCLQQSAGVSKIIELPHSTRRRILGQSVRHVSESTQRKYEQDFFKVSGELEHFKSHF
jgi:hypothetical protein